MPGLRLLWHLSSAQEPLHSCRCQITLEEITSGVDLQGDPLVRFGTKYVRAMYSTFQKEFAYTALENTFGCFAELVVGFVSGHRLCFLYLSPSPPLLLCPLITIGPAFRMILKSVATTDLRRSCGRPLVHHDDEQRRRPGVHGEDAEH